MAMAVVVVLVKFFHETEAYPSPGLSMHVLSRKHYISVGHATFQRYFLHFVTAPQIQTQIALVRKIDKATIQANITNITELCLLEHPSQEW